MTARHTILVVDDNEANIVLLDFLLTEHGYEVSTAVDAEAALAAIALRQPTLVLTDIQLPGASGLELTRRLKSDPATSGIRIIAVSAFAMPADEQRALAAGCDGYIAKPVDTRTLPALVAAIIDRG